MVVNGTLVVELAELLANDFDPEGDSLTVIVVDRPQNGDTLFDGSLIYNPNTDFVGTDTVTYQVSDGLTKSNLATITINVSDANFAPESNPDNYVTTENQTLIVNARAGVLSNDFDLNEGDQITASLVDDATNGSVKLNDDGSFEYTPNAGYLGEDSFTYRISDGMEDSEVTKVSISIRSGNQTPVANDDSFSVDEDLSLVIDLGSILENDIDPEGQMLNVIPIGVPEHGDITFDGGFLYTPDANFNGMDSFKYQVNDGEFASNPATIFITVKPIDDAPVAQGEAFETSVNESLFLNVQTDLLANDSDADGDSLMIMIVDQPTNGSLTFDSELIYTPDTDFEGTDFFSYEVSDGKLTSGVVTVTIEVVSPRTGLAAVPTQSSSLAEAIDEVFDDESDWLV